MPLHTLTPPAFCPSFAPLCLPVQHGESALQIAIHKGHLDMVKILLLYEVDQYYVDLPEDQHRKHLVEYLSSEPPTLKRKVSHAPFTACVQYT